MAKFNTASPEMMKYLKATEQPIGVNGTVCEHGSIMLHVNALTRTDDLRKSPGKDWQPVSGVGDTAFFRNVRDQHAELMVWTGPHHFSLDLGAPTGGTATSIRPKAIELAKVIVSKLR
jgi:hypothetical protein